jgi:hypothetical protein
MISLKEERYDMISLSANCQKASGTKQAQTENGERGCSSKPEQLPGTNDQV